MSKRVYVHYLVVLFVAMFFGWGGFVLYKFLDLEDTRSWTPTQVIIDKVATVQKSGPKNTYVYFEPKIWVSYEFAGAQHTQIVVDSGYDQVSMYHESDPNVAAQKQFPAGGSLTVLVNPNASTQVRSLSYLDRTVSFAYYAIWATFAVFTLFVLIMRGSWLRAAEIEDEAAKRLNDGSLDTQPS